MLSQMSCSIIAIRPIQLMSDTHEAIRAAQEVQADTLAPELFRQATEWFFRAKREYKFKNFYLAKEYAEKARRLAEQAEYESLRNGAIRTEIVGGPDPLSNSSKISSESEDLSTQSSAAIPNPQGTPADEFDQRKVEEDEAKKKREQEANKPANPLPQPGPQSSQENFFPPIRKIVDSIYFQN